MKLFNSLRAKIGGGITTKPTPAINENRTALRERKQQKFAANGPGRLIIR
jgi:hypothetical protein